MLGPDVIAERWYARTLESYPAETQPFLREERDPFRNPVAATMRNSLRVLAGEITGAMEAERTRAALLDIVRVRAVQDFSASEAVSFVFVLKDVLRECEGLNAEAERRVDELALTAFDAYMDCRERIAALRVKEAQRRQGATS